MSSVVKRIVLKASYQVVSAVSAYNIYAPFSEMTLLGWSSILGAVLLTSLVPVALTSSGEVKVTLTRLDTIFLPPGILGLRGVNEVAFDAEEKLFYVVSERLINVVSASDPQNLTVLASIQYPVPGSQGLTIKICGDRVYVGADTSPRVSPRRGVVFIFSRFDRQSGTLPLLSTIDYGPFTYPRNLQLSPDCQEMLVALENFPDFTTIPNKTVDLPGEVSLVTNPGSRYRKGRNMNFRAFDDQLEELRKQGVRFVESNNRFSDDIEISFIVRSIDQKKAYLILQETNAVGVLNLETGQLDSILGLGVKNWSHFLMDTSDRDGGQCRWGSVCGGSREGEKGGYGVGGVGVKNWSHFLMDTSDRDGGQCPDRVVAVEWQGEEYLLFADEGQAQLLSPSTTEQVRGKDILAEELADSVPQSLRDQLQDDGKLGRLLFSSVDGRNEEGKYEQLFHFGGRGCSIRRAEDMSLVFDTGGDFETLTAQLRPDIFNSIVRRTSQSILDFFDTRSPFRGPEPEGMTAGYVGDTLLFFCGMERIGQIFVYSVDKDIRRPKFQTLYLEGVPLNSSRTAQDLFDDKLLFDVDPEEIRYVVVFYEPGVVAEYAVLAIGGGLTNTLSLVRVDVTHTPQEYVPPPDDAPLSAFIGDAFRWLYTQSICRLFDISGCPPDDHFVQFKQV
ncbi:uncharacterized protein LOC143285655 [Babylonia areolata]|uniref:uncharacterized protein LOC143285655 n=1 Tax=Babylonia areolata TaxID=304850 RepID=UPI003FD4072E